MQTDDRRLILRRYQGSSFDSAPHAYEAELDALADAGWYPVASTWGWDTERAGVEWFLGGSSWMPGPGTLAVTFRREETPSS